jgi:GNAT superfamily N-acetyltransferase
VQAWAETYAGLLPAQEIAARDHAVRLRQWQGQIGAGRSRVLILPGVGFAQAGPQRDAALAAAWPEELYALYVLRAAHGTGAGSALLRAILPAGRFTALVLEGNDRAIAFYRRSGGRELARQADRMGAAVVTEIVLGWDGPPA